MIKRPSAKHSVQPNVQKVYWDIGEKYHVRLAYQLENHHASTMAQIPDNFKKPFKIAIVGGGIGGISLAIGLLRRGVPCQIYEAAPAFAEIGAGLGLGPNSVRSMKLIDPAIKAAYDKVKTKNLWKEEEETWINFRTGIGEPKMVAKVRTTDEDKTGLSSVHRAHFLDGIVKLVPEGVAHFGKRLADLSTVEAGGLQLTFDDGTKAEADAVVGCDGVKSRVRQLLLAKEDMLQDVTFTGKYAYRGLVPMEKAKEHLGGDLAENCQLYIGPGGHVMTYPIDHGTTVNVLAAKTKEDGKWDDEKWVLPHGKEGLVKDFKGWGPPVQGVVDVGTGNLSISPFTDANEANPVAGGSGYMGTV